MDRRISGSAVLTTALVLALAVPPILQPPYVDGVARIVLPRAPAAVGECLKDTPGSWALTETGAIMTPQPVTFVPCTEPHDSEVAYRDEALPGSRAYDTAAINDFQTRCSDRASALRGDPTATSEWKPDLSFDTAVLGPDRQQFGAGQRWAACAVEISVNGPSVANSRPLAALLDGAVPPEMGACAVGSPTDAYAGAVACTEPHTVESFGYRTIDAGSPLDQDGLQRSCRDRVAQAAGRPDLPTETSIVITAEAEAYFGDSSADRTVTLPLPAGAEGGWATCAVHTTDDRLLTASLREIGDAPLPWAP